MARTTHNRRLGCRSAVERDQSAWASSDTPLHPTTTNSAAPDHGATRAHTHQQGRPMTSGRLLRVRHRGCDRRAYGDTPLQTRVVPSWARRTAARRPAFAPVASAAFLVDCRGVSPYGRRLPHARLPSAAPMPRAAPTNRTAPNRGRIAIRPYNRSSSIRRRAGGPLYGVAIRPALAPRTSVAPTTTSAANHTPYDRRHPPHVVRHGREHRAYGDTPLQSLPVPA